MFVQPLLHSLPSFYVLSLKYFGFKRDVCWVIKVPAHHLVEGENSQQWQDVDNDDPTVSDLAVAVFDKNETQPTFLQLDLVVPKVLDLLPHRRI